MRICATLFIGALLCSPLGAQQLVERSKGYAGSLPPGQISTALVSLDCGGINRAPGLARMLVPLSDECEVVIPSPDGRYQARTRGGTLSIVERATGASSLIRNFEQPVAFRWAASSRAFFLNDGEGSGQTSRLLYFHRDGARWSSSRAFDRAAEAAYLKRYDCHGGHNAYANVSGIDWTERGRFRAIVTEGVHSKGCLRPYRDRNVLLEVTGDPFTGRLSSVREVRHID